MAGIAWVDGRHVISTVTNMSLADLSLMANIMAGGGSLASLETKIKDAVDALFVAAGKPYRFFLHIARRAPLDYTLCVAWDGVAPVGEWWL